MATQVAGAIVYSFGEPLGAGGMGVVYRGEMHSPAGVKPVALKQLPRAVAGDPELRDRLVGEARLVYRLTHANICQVFDLGHNEHGTFVVMELVDGCDLATLSQRERADGRQLPGSAALYAGREVARALAYAHRQRHGDGNLELVHGDVTPANILLSIEGEVKLTDFGVARSLAASSGQIGVTPGFSAPEAVEGAAEQRSDIFSLGASLAAALTGEPPRPDARHAEWLAARRPDLSRDLVAIVARATAADPADRFLSAEEIEEALSLELARRFPGFTPSQLAALVLRHRRAPAGPGESTRTITLHSLTQVDAGPVPAVLTAAPVAERPVTVTAAPSLRAGGTQTAMPTAPPPPRRFRRVAALVGVVAAASIGVAVAAIGGSDDEPAPRSAPAPAEVAATDPAPVPPPPVTSPPPAVDPPPADPSPPPAVAAREPEPAPSAPRKRPPRRPPPSGPAPPIADGYLTVTSDPWGEVFVDGRRVADETPAYRLRLPAGSHRVRVHFPSTGRSSATRTVEIASGEVATIGFRDD